MHFQADDLKPIGATLNRIQQTLGLDSDQMAMLLDIVPRQYSKALQEGETLPARSLMLLARELNLSFDALMMDQFCYRTLARHFSGDTSAIPEKYTEHGKGKRRILTTLLDFAESTTDWRRRLGLMRFLQINEAALEDPNSVINLRCTIEAVEWLYDQAGGGDTLTRLGKDMLLSPLNEYWTRDLKKSRSFYELFEVACSETGTLYQNVEKNFLWKIHRIIPGEKIVVRGMVSDEVREQISFRHIRSKPGFSVRQSLFAHMPQLLGLPQAPVRISRPFDSHSNFCEMELDSSTVLAANRKKAMCLLN